MHLDRTDRGTGVARLGIVLGPDHPARSTTCAFWDDEVCGRLAVVTAARQRPGADLVPKRLSDLWILSRGLGIRPAMGCGYTICRISDPISVETGPLEGGPFCVIQIPHFSDDTGSSMLYTEHHSREPTRAVSRDLRDRMGQEGRGDTESAGEQGRL